MYRYRRWKIAALAAIACWEAGIASGHQPPPCSQPIPVVHQVADRNPEPLNAQQHAAWRAFLMGDAHRIVEKFPTSAAMGTAFRVNFTVSPAGVRSVSVHQTGYPDSPDNRFDLPIQRGEDGHAYVMVPPLALGMDQFSIDAIFTDWRWSGASFAVNVGLPDAPPLRFVANELFTNTSGPIVQLNPGGSYGLVPRITFASAPNNEIELSPAYPKIRAALHFRVRPGAGDPVVSVDQEGKITGLRVGTAVVEVVFGDYVAPFTIRVRAPSVLDGALIFHMPDSPVKP